MAVGAPEVEEWLDANPDWAHDYFLRKVDVSFINKWLVLHGFHTLQDYITTRRGSLSHESSDQTSPDSRSNETFFSEKEGRHQRSNSKKYLRHDFARAKMRGIFRTCESPSVNSDTLEQRRSSLKGMRQFLSLPPNNVNMLSMLIQSKVRLPRYTSIDEELKRQLRMCNERDFFLEIIKDISHELDLKSLTGRIIMNICILLNADRSSLFFVEGSKGKNQSLVSKVFDVYTGTNCIPTSKGDNIVRIPWGQGIIGHVAATGETVNITNASKDPRYNDDVDRIVGYTTDSLLCMPMRNADEEIIGVAQAINKTQSDHVGVYMEDGPAFDKDAEKMLEMYLTFCGMAISNAQAMESYSKEYDRNRDLLEAVHDLFEQMTCVEDVIHKIMQRAKTLLKCERCLVVLKDHREQSNPMSEGFSRMFDLHQQARNGHVRNGPENACSELPRPNRIIEIVGCTGETVNIADVQTDARFRNSFVDVPSGFHTKSILCKPIRNSKSEIIGVAQLLNRADGLAFDDNDDRLFEAFTIFCGLGINNCILYDELDRTDAKKKVALEVLSYHAAVTHEDVLAFKAKQIPECTKWRIHALDFNDFGLSSDQMVLAGIRIFKDMGLITTFRIDYETLVRWLLTVRKNYRNIAYHNWRHAFNVCQFMFTLLQTCGMKRHLTETEVLALIVGCLCHDLDHRGTNNAFQHKSSSALSQLYGTSATLEHHHFNHAVMILQSHGHNIFANISSTDYIEVMNYLKLAILATDISLHIQVRQRFFPFVESGLDTWDNQENKDILRSILMTSCDIATITKPWEVQRKAADCVVTEFFDQGDKEKNVLKIQPQALMDRERIDELPRLQMEWIDSICLPLYKGLTKMDPHLRPSLDRVYENRAQWDVLNKRLNSKPPLREFKETGV